jgi:hypothetical protein
MDNDTDDDITDIVRYLAYYALKGDHKVDEVVDYKNHHVGKWIKNWSHNHNDWRDNLNCSKVVIKSKHMH